MSDQSQTTANTPSDPVLCKMGCGFFGNGATGGMCSKCWRDQQKQACPPASSPKPAAVKTEDEPEPMDVEPSAAPVKKEEAAAAAAPVVTKKKKKKASYKNMMATMMKGTTDRDVEQEKEALRKVTGGGTFSKIDKI